MIDDSRTRMTASELKARVRELMPRLKDELALLIAIPSVSAPGYPEATRPALLRAHDEVARLFREAGAQAIDSLKLPETAPIVTGEFAGPSGAPTALLYTHYDVVGAGDEAAWDTPPFKAVERDGAVFGRGTADAKAQILVHLGALRAWGGKPPVNIKLFIEGQEEVGSRLAAGYPSAHPDVFSADAILVADEGNIRPGEPSICISSRGDAVVIVEARTLRGARDSGQFGGAAPDALVALTHALATLHDARGDVAVAGLRRDPWPGASQTDNEFRAIAGVAPGAPLFGSGGLGERLWSGPAITITGIDAPPVDEAAPEVQPHARAALNVRVAPGQRAAEAQAAVIRHLEAARPLGVRLTARAGDAGDGFATSTSGPVWAAMVDAMAAAWGRRPSSTAAGYAIPVVKALADGVPQATIILFGACDQFADIHGPNERVLLDELEKAVLAEALFFAELSERWREDRA